MATIGQYEDLIVPEHQGQPNFTATVDLSCQPYVDEQNLLANYDLLFDLDVAVGAQLDAVGVRIGRSRQVTTPLTGVYFAWDTAGLGWDQGYWQGEFDPSTGVTSLDDATYRLLLDCIMHREPRVRIEVPPGALARRGWNREQAVTAALTRAGVALTKGIRT